MLQADRWRSWSVDDVWLFVSVPQDILYDRCAGDVRPLCGGPYARRLRRFVLDEPGVEAEGGEGDIHSCRAGRAPLGALAGRTGDPQGDDKSRCALSFCMRAPTGTLYPTWS